MAQPALVGRELGVAEDAGRQVGDDDAAARAGTPRGCEGLSAGAARDVEHPEPSPTPAASSIASVDSPSHSSSVGPQRCQASEASSHCSLVVAL